MFLRGEPMGKYLTTEQLISLNSMTDDLKDNFDDPVKANSILRNMLEVMGEKPMFETTEDFIRFMESDEPLVL